MDNSLEHFKAAIARRNKRKEKQSKTFNKKYLDGIRSNIHQNLEFPNLKKEELDILKAKIRKERKLHLWKERIVYVIVMLILVFVFFRLI